MPRVPEQLLERLELQPLTLGHRAEVVRHVQDVAFLEVARLADVVAAHEEIGHVLVQQLAYLLRRPDVERPLFSL
jgi:hypothetical protein